MFGIGAPRKKIVNHINLALGNQAAGATGILKGFVFQIMADKGEGRPFAGTR
jgi:hypothetical protein